MSTVKVVFSEKDTRRVGLPPKDAFQFLLSVVSKSFVPQPGFENSNPPFFIKYYDEDQELVTISSEEELHDAVELQSNNAVLKVHIFPNTSSANVSGVEFDLMDSVVMIHNNTAPSAESAAPSSVSAPSQSGPSEAAIESFFEPPRLPFLQPIPAKTAAFETGKFMAHDVEDVDSASSDGDLVKVSAPVSPDMATEKKEIPKHDLAELLKTKEATNVTQPFFSHQVKPILQSSPPPYNEGPSSHETLPFFPPILQEPPKNEAVVVAAELAPSKPADKLKSEEIKVEEAKADDEKPKRKPRRQIKPTVTDVIQSLAASPSLVRACSQALPVVANGRLREVDPQLDLSQFVSLVVSETISHALPAVDEGERRFALDVIRGELVAHGLASFPHMLEGMRKDLHALVKSKLKDHRKSVKQAQKDAKKAEKEAEKEAKKAAKVVRKLVKVDRSSKVDLNAEGVPAAPVELKPPNAPATVPQVPLPVVSGVVETKATVPSPSPAPVQLQSQAPSPQPCPKVENKIEEPQPKVDQPQLPPPSNVEPNFAPSAPVMEPNVSNDQLLSRMLDAIPQLLQQADLSRTTMRMIRQQLALSFPEAFVEDHKQEIKERVSQVIRDMPNPNNAQNTVIFHPPNAPAAVPPVVASPAPPPAVAPIAPAPVPEQPQFPADATAEERAQLSNLAGMGFNNHEINLYYIRQTPNRMDQVVEALLSQKM